jgi:hypothetical protein
MFLACQDAGTAGRNIAGLAGGHAMPKFIIVSIAKGVSITKGVSIAKGPRAVQQAKSLAGAAGRLSRA